MRPFSVISMVVYAGLGLSLSASVACNEVEAKNVASRHGKGTGGIVVLPSPSPSPSPSISSSPAPTGTPSSGSAHYPLEIIQPRAGLDARNRFYRAYPGLPFVVRAAVFGGAYPFIYALTAAPSGMVIHPNTGEVSWPNPIASGTPYAVALQVTDAEGTSVSVAWSISVTTAGFYFIDAVNGKTSANGGTGTLNNPWRVIQDFFVSKYDTSHQNGFVYFRNGTYPVPALENGSRLPLSSGTVPKVWLNYPGETPVLDMSAAYVMVEANGDNCYMGGLTFTNIQNPARQAVQISGDASHVTFYKNDFHGTTSSGLTNMAHIFIGTQNGWTPGSGWAIQNNLFHDSDETMAIEGYLATKVVVEDNSVYNLANSNSHGIGAKVSCSYWDIRHNIVNNVAGSGIWLDAAALNGTFANNLVRFNYVSHVPFGSNALQVGYDADSGTPAGIHHIERNTFLGPVDFWKTSSMAGPFYLAGNVIQNSAGGITYKYPDTAPAGVMNISSDNLLGTSGLVDVDGNLVPSYSSFLGAVGWQF